MSPYRNDDVIDWKSPGPRAAQSKIDKVSNESSLGGAQLYIAELIHHFNLISDYITRVSLSTCFNYVVTLDTEQNKLCFYASCAAMALVV